MLTGPACPPSVDTRTTYLVYLAPDWSPVRGSGIPNPLPVTEPSVFLSRVRRVIEKASSLKLRVEGWGTSLPFLKSKLYSTSALPDIGVKEPTFHCNPGDS